MSHRKYYNFTDKIRGDAFARQQRKCAICARDLADLEDRGHHVIPVQSGNPKDPQDDVIKTLENCVMLCVMCHDDVAHQGDTVSGVIPPPAYYKHSHGTSAELSQKWSNALGIHFDRIMNRKRSVGKTKHDTVKNSISNVR